MLGTIDRSADSAGMNGMVHTVATTPLRMPDTPLQREARTDIDAGIGAGSTDAKRLMGDRDLHALQGDVLEIVRPGVPSAERLRADASAMHDDLRLRTPQLDAASLWQAEHGLKSVWVDFLQAHARELAPGVDASRAVQLLHDVREATGAITTYAKQQLGSPRPFVFDPTLPPVDGTHGPRQPFPPGSPKANGYPSGHSSLAVAQATVLAALLPAHRDELLEAARQVGLARVYGVMHFPSDVEAGARIGTIVADWMLAHSSLAPHVAAVAA